jgi:hypothetical protein
LSDWLVRRAPFHLDGYRRDDLRQGQASQHTDVDLAWLVDAEGAPRLLVNTFLRTSLRFGRHLPVFASSM